MFLNLKQQRFYLKSYERAYSNLNPWTETTCKHNRSHLPLIPAVGLALGARQILGHHERISMRVLGGISSPAQSHTQWGLCKMLASWDHCQTTNKWYYGILALPQRGAVASLYTTPAASFCHLHTHTHLYSVHTPAWLCVMACDSRSHVYPCELMCMCFHTFRWFCAVIAHFEATLCPCFFPTSSSLSPSFIVSSFMCSNKRRLGSVKTILSYVWPVNFF